MNTLKTDHGPLEMDRREAYRQRLIASRLPKERVHYDFHGAPISLWECIKLTAVALVILGGLGYALAWGLR